MRSETKVKLELENYESQQERWPRAGRHILAQFDSDTIVVYQSYAPEIGRFAADIGFFGGAFSYSRMSWVKPNFLWMMYRSGWGTKPNQEVTLAVTLRREAFDAILAAAVPSSFVRDRYETQDAWKADVARSDVRLQWDPDHGPRGNPLERRAIQLGLRGETLRQYGKEWIVRLDDISEFVSEQRERLAADGSPTIRTPKERVYPVADQAVKQRLGIDVWEEPVRP